MSKQHNCNEHSAASNLTQPLEMGGMPQCPECESGYAAFIRVARDGRPTFECGACGTRYYEPHDS